MLRRRFHLRNGANWGAKWRVCCWSPLAVSRFLWIAAFALAAACGAPESELDQAAPAAELPSDPNAFRADAEESGYAGEWASALDECDNLRAIWTIEERRMGMKRERFCFFDRIAPSRSDQGQGWTASARCLAGGRESRDFVFFRINPNRLQMRVTINDSETVDLVRCPQQT
jgi:hypothetical protein